MLTSEFLSDSISFRTSQPIGHFILTSLMFPASLGSPPNFNFFSQVLFLTVLLKFVPEIEQTLM